MNVLNLRADFCRVYVIRPAGRAATMHYIPEMHKGLGRKGILFGGNSRIIFIFPGLGTKITKYVDSILKLLLRPHNK